MANTKLGIIKKRDIAKQLLELRNAFVKEMHKNNFTVEEIASVICLDKASVSRIIRFGSNTNTIKKGKCKDIIK